MEQTCCMAHGTSMRGEAELGARVLTCLTAKVLFPPRQLPPAPRGGLA